ncbi:hypothetical protein TRVA0_009S02124 [Trichomonascus vanleenenianus]|uniref:uncharacterized protein n=1 Tax=Trichomonascus vanleenenianus TaxID=2268995 RepID=UPI003ECB69FC
MAVEERLRSGGGPIAEEPEEETREEEQFSHSRESSMDTLMRRKSMRDHHRRTDSSHSTHSTHRQMSSSSSIESADSSRSYASSTTTVGSKSNTNTTTTAPHRKRLSLNFTSLPVVGSPYTSPSASTNSSGGDYVYGHSPSRSVTLSRRKTIASEPVSNGHHHYNSISYSEAPLTRARAGSQSINSSIGGPSSSSSSSNNGTESINGLDQYLAKLAAKERKVGELKEEFKRVQLALKQAEDDLRQFRRQASSAIAPPSLEPVESRPSASNSTTSVPAAIPSASNAKKNHDTTNTAMNTTIRTPKKSSLDSYEPPKIEKPAPTKHVALRSTSPTHHHNHAAHMTPSNYGLAPVATTGALLPPRDDVLNMGRRVVEELGTQFWGLFEDIKNVTIGDDPFTPVAPMTTNNNNSGTPSHPPQSSTSLRRRRSTRNDHHVQSTTANSYYML